MTTEPPRQPMPDTERKRRLSQNVATALAQGWRVESQSDELAVLIKGRRPNHVLHLILSLLTLGVWLLVWLGLVIFGGEKRRTLSIDQFGAVQDSEI